MRGAPARASSVLMLAGWALLLVFGCGARTARENLPELPPSVGLPAVEQPGIRPEPGHLSTYPDNQVVLGAPCSQEEMEALALEAEREGIKALQVAGCYAAAMMRPHPSQRRMDLDAARTGRRYAELAVREFPESGLAHYLLALLTAWEAERNPAKGLQLVPAIEREALWASRLNPALDHGGPHRLLGELYLRAPGFPMSLGDSAKSEAHFRQAVSYDPDYPENRLGLVEALMARERNREACHELSMALTSLIGRSESKDSAKSALNLLGKLCSRLED